MAREYALKQDRAFRALLRGGIEPAGVLSGKTDFHFRGRSMIFEQIATGGCQSYLLGCGDSHAAVLIDPNLPRSTIIWAWRRATACASAMCWTPTPMPIISRRPRSWAGSLDVPVVAHTLSPAPYADFRLADGEILRVGSMRLQALHTPGHTRDSMCVVVEDRVFTGDTLLIGGTGRTDLPTGDPDALYDSLFGRLLKLDPALKVYPAHDYKGRSHSTIGDEIAANPRLQKRERAEFIEMMNQLNLDAPTHLTEALRTNMSGGKTVAQLLAEAAAPGAVHLHGRTGGAGGPQRSGPDAAGCAGEGRLRRRPYSRRAAICRAASWNCGSTRNCPIPPGASWCAASSARSRPWRRRPCANWASPGAAALDGGMKAWRETRLCRSDRALRQVFGAKERAYSAARSDCACRTATRRPLRRPRNRWSRPWNIRWRAARRSWRVRRR